MAGMTARLLAPACRPGSWRTCCRGGSLANSSVSTTGSGAVPATSPDPRTPAQAHPRSMSAMWMDAFLDWYATRHEDVPEAVTEATGTILGEWGPRENPDERSFYACSPHRIEMAAHLIREGYFVDYANPALRLLPEWTEWCIEQSDSTETPLPGPAKRPAPRLRCSLTTRMTSRPPRMTRHRSAAMSEPHRVGLCAMPTRRSRSAPDHRRLDDAPWPARPR